LSSSPAQPETKTQEALCGRRIGDRRATSMVEKEPGGSDVMEATEEIVSRRFD